MDYRKTGDLFKVGPRLNYAFNYRYSPSARDKLDISLGMIRGDTLFANFTVHSNLNNKGKPRYIAPP